MKSFVKEYFDDKTGDSLLKTITPDWNTTKEHLNLLKIPKGINSVFEVGCGVGRLLKEINKDVEHCVGVDASQSMIDEGKNYCEGTDVELLKCSGEGNVPVPLKDYFDYVFSIITFQHIPNTETIKKYISEMYRLLKVGGTIKFQLLAEDEFPEKDLWTYHDFEELMNYMKELGFNKLKKERDKRWMFIGGEK